MTPEKNSKRFFLSAQISYTQLFSVEKKTVEKVRSLQYTRTKCLQQRLQFDTWRTAVCNLEVFADVRTRILAEDIMNDRNLTTLLVITEAHYHLHVT